MRYTKNPNQDEKRSFKPYPEGRYDLEITKVEEGVSSKAKSPQLIVRATILEGAHANKKVTMYLSTVEAAMWKVEQIFEAAGLEPKETGEVDEHGSPVLEINEQELVGRALIFEAEITEYNGKERNEWWVKGVSEFDTQGNSSAGDDGGDDEEFVGEEEAVTGAKPAQGNGGTSTRPRRPSKSA